MSDKPKKQLITQAAQGLPAKISGLVFWGMVLVGMLVAFILLHEREDDLRSTNSANVIISIYSLAQQTEEYPFAPVMQRYRSALTRQLENLIREYGFRAISLSSGEDELFVGETKEDDDTVSSSFTALLKDGSSQKFNATIYLPNQKAAAEQDRNRLLLAIGALVFVFALVLQRILRSMIAKPFDDMTRTAEQFAKGDRAIRFNEIRTDEFGFLSRFINQALDEVTNHQSQLEDALSRATSTEIELAQEKEFAEVTLQSIGDAVITTDEHAGIKYMNPAAEHMLGVDLQEALDEGIHELMNLQHEKTGDKMPNPIAICLKTGEPVSLGGSTALLKPNGQSISIEASAAPMRSSDDLIGAVIIIQDVSRERRLNQQLTFQASHDSLTGLYNRHKFEERIENALLTASEENRHHVLMYLDLDQFKIVNDTCGHVAGDALLRQLASVMGKDLRDSDTLARLGGDEFGVLLENCPLKEALLVAEKLRHTVKEFRLVWEEKTFEIGASIGVVEITKETQGISAALTAVDIACYAAKEQGRNRVHLYELADEASVQRHGEINWVTRIAEAFSNGLFDMYIQSIDSLKDHQGVQHYELLLRMEESNGHIISPNSFLPAAERYGLILNVDRWVVERSFALIRDFPKQPQTQYVFSINLSGATFSHDELVDEIKGLAKQYAISLTQVCFEVTETVAVSNLDKAQLFMRELRKEGCHFALDDFGTGLSSFGYLKNLPVDYLKIDGSFVKDMVSDPVDNAMVSAITQVGHVMRLQTIAEWVEDERTIELLRLAGVDFAQGFYLDKPKPMRDVIQQLSKNQTSHSA